MNRVVCSSFNEEKEISRSEIEYYRYFSGGTDGYLPAATRSLRPLPALNLGTILS